MRVLVSLLRSASYQVLHGCTGPERGVANLTVKVFCQKSQSVVNQKPVFWFECRASYIDRPHCWFHTFFVVLLFDTGGRHHSARALVQRQALLAAPRLGCVIDVTNDDKATTHHEELNLFSISAK